MIKMNKKFLNQTIEILESNGTNNGYCMGCGNFFKKGDYFIVFEKGKINQIAYYKICAKCYINHLANKIGWRKLNKLILELCEEKI